MEQLAKLSTWAAKQDSNPMADTAGEAIAIEGAVRKEDFERFLKSRWRVASHYVPRQSGITKPYHNHRRPQHGDPRL